VECHQKSHASSWEIIKLDVFDKPTACQAMLEIDEEIEYGARGEVIADWVVIGDNIVVPCESENGKQF
jgi:hypothetical protein